MKRVIKRTCSSSTLAARGNASEALTITVERTMLYGYDVVQGEDTVQWKR